MNRPLHLLLAPLCALSLLLPLAARTAPAPDTPASPAVERVLVVFKTHLDIGFTDLSSSVEQRYVDHFIPRAIEVARALREAGGEERYVWTTGAWLIDAYRRQAAPEAVARLDEAIRCGDLAWNGVPYTLQSESADAALYTGMLRLSQRLDARYDKRTVAAKMTDVPGHTRAIVPLLADAGIRLLHVGTNPVAPVPRIPSVCRWRDRPSGKEIMLMYNGDYGSDMLLPDGRTAVAIVFTYDNQGPHTVEGVRGIYADLRKRYPGARIEAVSLNAVAEALDAMRDSLPVVESEIGDTWIYGYGSAPLRMARFRALQRLHAAWIDAGRLDPASDAAVDFAVRLGMIAEHTWGADIKTFLQNWDAYDLDTFRARRLLPPFRLAERSWQELDDNIGKAVALLPEELQAEALEALLALEPERPEPIRAPAERLPEELDAEGRYRFDAAGVGCLAGGVAYQTYSADDYQRFFDRYFTRQAWWAISDYGKPGLENSAARSATLEARVVASERTSDARGELIRCDMAFPADTRIDARVLPEAVRLEYRPSADGRSLDISLTLHRKPANRLPEAYWFSFRPERLAGLVAEKTGSRIDLSDVAAGGNRRMHAIDRYIDLQTPQGTLRITSPDAFLVAVGERHALNYSTDAPDLEQGIHFCLYDNLWGTNFSMWWEGSVRYRFHVELLPATK